MMGYMDGSNSLLVIFWIFLCLDMLVGNLEIGMLFLCRIEWVIDLEIGVMGGWILIFF